MTDILSAVNRMLLFAKKALIIAGPLAIIVWVASLIGLINNAPYPVVTLIGTTQMQSFSALDYAERIALPIFVIAVLLAAFGEKELSNDLKKHWKQTLAIPAALALEVTGLVAVAGPGWLATWAGLALSFWIYFITSFILGLVID